MAETAIEKNQEECKMVGTDNEENGENRDSDAYLGTSTTFLGKLNLVLILSFMSLSAEECIDFEEIEKNENVKFPEAKDTISRLHARKREINEFKALQKNVKTVQEQATEEVDVGDQMLNIFFRCLERK
ncbi:hypothetical protein RHMOL_Rhmol07G0008800 [Rhododendron molle]|uniref:Uncharacterized protein n=1 Tax=Rhododendron molle TaxID=49168 RepID=A0ACC0MW69_RHOML|nr:hypothetical protein RHMOL_Rhmol07G0008800 [Rhododendron molle]